MHLTTPKTAAALRTHHGRQAFQRQAAGDVWHGCDLVFASETDGPLKPSNALRNLSAIIKKANEEAETSEDRLPPFHIHDLRHAHATHLLMDRWDVARVARRVGHANPAITLKPYAK